MDGDTPDNTKQCISYWKPYLSFESTLTALNQLKADSELSSFKHYAAVPFHYMKPLKEKFSSGEVAIGANSMLSVEKGVFTEPIAPKLLMEAGAQFVVLRTDNEKKENLNQKIKRALEAGLPPFVCLGENLEAFMQDKSKEILVQQLQESLKDLKAEQLKLITLIYEAPWIQQYPSNPEEKVLAKGYKQFREAVENQFGKKLHVPIVVALTEEKPHYFDTQATGYFLAKPITYSELLH